MRLWLKKCDHKNKDIFYVFLFSYESDFFLNSRREGSTEGINERKNVLGLETFPFLKILFAVELMCAGK